MQTMMLQLQRRTPRRLVSCLVVGCFLILAGCVRPSEIKSTPEAAQQLLKLRGYEFNEKSFLAAAGAHDILAINAFLDAGINPNVQDAVDGRTALISAAARGDLEVVKLLLSRHANLNVKDKRGYTALSHAIEAMYEDVADVLLSQPDLDPNSRGLNGSTALITYVWRDRKDAVQKLLDHGADVNAQDADGDTALHGVAQTGNVEVLKMLLAKGANTNTKNRQGGTPLMWAAAYGNVQIARSLLDHGADPLIKDGDGMTAGDWAAKNKRENIVLLLKRK
jgi:uncharacterized protein